MRADFDALASEATRIDAVADSIEERVRAARTRVEELLENGWTGASSASFRAAHGQWEAHARENVATLRRLVDGLQGAAADLLIYEQNVVHQTEALGAGLPVIDVAARMRDDR